MKGLLMGIISLAVGLFVAAAVLPTAIVNMTDTSNWTGAPAAVITLGTTVVGIVSVVALILILLRR